MARSTKTLPDKPFRAQELTFIDHFATNANATQAAIAAGWNPRSAKQTGSVLARRPDIQLELRRRQDLLIKVADFDLQTAFATLQSTYRFAIEMGNAMAATKCAELMAKLAGHLRDKLDITVSLPSAAAALAEARGRIVLPDHSNTIDAEVVSFTPITTLESILE